MTPAPGTAADRVLSRDAAAHPLAGLPLDRALVRLVAGDTTTWTVTETLRKVWLA